MLVVQEVHRVKGTAVEELESTTQQFWKEAAPLGVTPAWFLEVSHGTGPSYASSPGSDWTTGRPGRRTHGPWPMASSRP